MAGPERGQGSSPPDSPARKQQRRDAEADGEDSDDGEKLSAREMAKILEKFQSSFSDVQEQLKGVVGAVSTLSSTVGTNEKKLRQDMAGLVGAVDGSKILRYEDSASLSKAESLGIDVADNLLAQGAAEILASVSH